MILTMKDRNRFLKAALKTTDPDMKRWLVACVDMLDGLPEGQNGAETPEFEREPAREMPPMSPILPVPGDGAYELAGQMLGRPDYPAPGRDAR